MPSLRELQCGFAQGLLRDEDGPPPFATVPTAAASARFAVYRRAFRANYRQALAASYPVVRRLVGPPFFDAAVDAYVRDQPPTSGDLNRYGDTFGGFLDQYPPGASLPYLGDVARLEWAQDEAGRAADAPLAAADIVSALAALAPDRLPFARLALAPSCRLVASPYPVLRIWRANQPDTDGHETVMLDEGEDRLLVRRDPDGIAVERLAPALHAWLAAIARAAPLGDALDAAQAVDPAFDVSAALASRILDGTLGDVRGR